MVGIKPERAASTSGMIWSIGKDLLLVLSKFLLYHLVQIVWAKSSKFLLFFITYCTSLLKLWKWVVVWKLQQGFEFQTDALWAQPKGMNYIFWGLLTMIIDVLINNTSSDQVSFSRNRISNCTPRKIPNLVLSSHAPDLLPDFVPHSCQDSSRLLLS